MSLSLQVKLGMYSVFLSFFRQTTAMREVRRLPNLFILRGLRVATY